MIKVKNREDIPYHYTGLVILWDRVYVYIEGKMGECPFPDNGNWTMVNYPGPAWIALNSSEFQDWIRVFYQTFANEPAISRDLMCYILGSKND